MCYGVTFSQEHRGPTNPSHFCQTLFVASLTQDASKHREIDLSDDEGVRPLALHELLDQKRIASIQSRSRHCSVCPSYSGNHTQVLRRSGAAMRKGFMPRHGLFNMDPADVQRTCLLIL